MAFSMCSMHPTPIFVIETCSSIDNKELIKTRTISSKNKPFQRSFSLPNYNETYKDLGGAVHYSSSKYFKNRFIRSCSYPNNYEINEKHFHSQLPSISMNFSLNLLDPSSGTHSPAGSSSRYSLYGSFFDLSENEYHPSTIKSDHKRLIFNAHSVLVIEKSSRLSTNTYQDKCNDWLGHINSK